MKKTKNKNDEWNTPPWFVSLVRKVLKKIDLDPMSNNVAQETILAEKFFTKEDNSLTKNWEGKVYLNPPYSNALIKKSLIKLNEEFLSGRTTEFICLTNSSTDSMWNQLLTPYTQIYTKGRIIFDSAIGLPSVGNGRGQCVTYGGPNWKRFLRVFLKDDRFWCPNIHLIRERAT